MRSNISLVFQEIRKDFDEIHEDEYCEMLDDVINAEMYRPILVSVTDIMMCFEKYMIENNHCFVFMNAAEKEVALINTIKEHLIPSPTLENIQKTIIPFNAVKNLSIP